MGARALIIAIESYPGAQGGGLTQTLPGTLQAGRNFRDWLAKKWKAEGRAAADTQLLFCSEPVEPGGTGASNQDIRKALLALKTSGQGTTEELYVFFGGHGFSFVDKPGSRADILIASDFTDPALSGASCLKLDEIIGWLRDHLGPGRHYYFVDACRNRLDVRQIVISSLLPIDPQTTTEASTFVLQSTVAGAVAAVAGRFPIVLMAGLHGKGNAKTWDARINDAMVVKYGSLRSYVKECLKNVQPITGESRGEDTESDAVLATLRPIPHSTCTINVRNVSSRDKGKVIIVRNRSNAPTLQPLTLPSMQLDLEPDLYTISLELADASVDPAKHEFVNLYDDQTLSFEKVEGPVSFSGTERSALSDVNVVVPSGTTVTVHNLDIGADVEFSETTRATLPPGRYSATLRANNQVVKSRYLSIEAGQPLSIDLASWPKGAAHLAIANRLPHYQHGVDFSESLGGPVTDPDLNLWLAIVGAGRILGPRGDYSKLAGFPLHNFLGEPPGGSPIYVLGGFDDPATRLRVAVSTDANVAWNDAVEPSGMPGIREFYVPVAAGSQLVSLRIGTDKHAYTVASFATANRGTLLTVTLDGEGDPNVSQYLLPLGHLIDHLEPEVQNRLQYRNHLADVKFLAEAGRAFRKRRNLRKAVPGPILEEMLYAKWCDPIGSSLAAYELLRRNEHTWIPEVVRNMKRFFGDFPDTAALAKLSGLEEPGAGRRGVPLFLDGLRAFPDYAQWLPLPAGRLDFSSPWTAWWAAVTEVR